MEINASEQKALRRCAFLCWQNREKLGLVPTDVEQTLIAWMAVGTEAEGEAASEVLAAMRITEAKQATFDRLLGN